MADEDDIVVTIEGDMPQDEGNQVVKVEDAATQVAKPTQQAHSDDDIIGSLKKQLETANQRASSLQTTASQAEARARQAEQQASVATQRAVESTKSTIESGIAAAKAEADAAEQAYQAAFEAGNARDMAKAQRQMARAEADLVLLEQTREDIKSAPEPRQEAHSAPQQSGDVVADWINAQAPAARDWLHAHKEYAYDPKKNTKLQAAHFDAVASDISPNSPSYFEHIERFLGLTKAPEQQTQRTERRPTAPTAPVTQTGGGMNGGQREVTLTAGEARAATDGTLIWNYDDPSGKNRFKKGDPIGVQEMARRKMALSKDGKYDNINV